MPFYWLFLIVAALAAIGFVLGRQRALASAGGDSRALHSLPNFYGWNVALTVLTPAFGLLALWLLIQPVLIENVVSSAIPDSALIDGQNRSLLMSDVRRIADGLNLLDFSTDGVTDLEALRTDLGSVGVALGSEIRPEILTAAQDYRAKAGWGRVAMAAAVLIVAIGGLAVSLMMTASVRSVD